MRRTACNDANDVQNSIDIFLLGMFTMSIQGSRDFTETLSGNSIKIHLFLQKFKDESGHTGDYCVALK